jgi:hypothetical protein
MSSNPTTLILQAKIDGAGSRTAKTALEWTEKIDRDPQKSRDGRNVE